MWKDKKKLESEPTHFSLLNLTLYSNFADKNSNTFNNINNKTATFKGSKPK